MSRKIITLGVIIVLILTGSYSAFAEEFDPGKTGSISVTLADQNEPIAGAELSVYYVATATLDADGDLIYAYTEDFEQLNVSIDDKSLAVRLDAYTAQYRVPSVQIKTDADGTAWCKDLPLGLYFVKQTGAVEGFALCTPFLVTVPHEKDGEYLYEVNASPKTEVSKLTSITIKKVWNIDESAEATEGVTVQLLKDGTVIKTARLDKNNHWQMTYNDMPQSDAYSVKEVDVPKGFTDTYTQNGYVFTVINTPTLIETGQLIWPIPLLAAGGVLLISAGVALLQKKREPHA